MLVKLSHRIVKIAEKTTVQKSADCVERRWQDDIQETEEEVY